MLTGMIVMILLLIATMALSLAVASVLDISRGGSKSGLPRMVVKLVLDGQRKVRSLSRTSDLVPKWVEGCFTPQEQEAFSPISDLISKAEDRAVKAFYGSSSNPFSAGGIVRLSDAPRTPQILPVKPRTSGTDWVGEQTRPPGGNPWTGDPREKGCTYNHQAGVYQKYVPGLGIVSAVNMDKLDRAIEVLRADKNLEIVHLPKCASEKEVEEFKIRWREKNARLGNAYFYTDLPSDYEIAIRDHNARIKAIEELGYKYGLQNPNS